MITEQQREARKHGIGGSDAPAILGVSPYLSAVELWQQKTGLVEPPNLDGQEFIKWGNRLEPAILSAFTEESGKRTRKVNETLADRKHPFLLAHLDGRVVGERALVEVKTTGALDGDQPRADHLVQVQHYLSVAGLDAGYLVYFQFIPRTLTWFRVERDDDAIEQLVAAEVDFWHHVRERIPPQPQTVFDLRLLFRQDNGGTVIASDEVRAAADQLAQIKAMAKDLEAQAEAAEKLVLEALGENSTLIADDGQVLATWKQAKPSRTFDRARLEAEHPELAEQYLVEKPGARRFLLKVAA